MKRRQIANAVETLKGNRELTSDIILDLIILYFNGLDNTVIFISLCNAYSLFHILIICCRFGNI